MVIVAESCCLGKELKTNSCKPARVKYLPSQTLYDEGRYDKLLPVAIVNKPISAESSNKLLKDDEELKNEAVAQTKPHIFLKGEGELKDEAFAQTKPQIKENNMFLRAQNREFEGMTYKDESIWKGEYKFICMGDTQLGMFDQEIEEKFSRTAVDFINHMKDHINFVVICGDHTHNLEGFWSKNDVEKGREKRKQELDAYKKIYSKLHQDIPLVCVCGNHDVGDRPTPKTIQMYTKEFGSDYLAFWSGGVKFFVLNSQIIQGLEASSELSREHEKWADTVLEEKHENEPIHLVGMCHIPPFCWDPEEKVTNFNWPKKKRERWLDKMVKANVKKVYCAHYHRRAGGKYKELEVVVTGAVGTNIRTKDCPAKLQSSIDKFNLKVSREGFGSIVANEHTSGLNVVTVTKEGLHEKWMSIAQISERVNRNRTCRNVQK